jgi:hypothetical protein
MTLGDKQRRFTELVGRLIQWAYSNGYELTFGEAYRTPEQAALNAQKGVGISKSLHTQRLAVDLMLFIDDVWQTAPEPYKPLGDYWKSLDPDCAWGGDFKMKDAVHFSLSHEGIK